MPTDLTPRVIESQDTEYLERGTGHVRRVTIVTYLLGALGPFREEFDRDSLTEYELRARMQRKADALRGFV